MSETLEFWLVVVIMPMVVGGIVGGLVGCLLAEWNHRRLEHRWKQREALTLKRWRDAVRRVDLDALYKRLQEKGRWN